MRSRTGFLAILLVIPFVVVAGFLLGNAGGGSNTGDDAGSLEVSDGGDIDQFARDFLISAGTADRIDAGEAVEIVPQELVMSVGEAIRIVNEDDVGHIVGVFYVGAGETLTQRFETPGELSGECSVHPSGSFTLRVVEA